MKVDVRTPSGPIQSSIILRPFLLFHKLTTQIVEQAGYDVTDGLDFLSAEDLSFLLKFVYKRQLLGPAVGLSLICMVTISKSLQWTKHSPSTR
jgi:hypothetical protein